MPATPNYQWIRITADPALLEWQANGLCLLEVNGKKLTLASWQGQIYAFAWKCPHAGGIMTDGYLDAQGSVVCPLHRYKFSISSGKNISGEGFHLAVYPLEIRPEGLFIGFKEKGFWNWL